MSDNNEELSNHPEIIKKKPIFLIMRNQGDYIGIKEDLPMNNQEMMALTTVDNSEFEELVKEVTASGSIDQNLYIEYDVKRGLRDSNGNGVLTGLTEISDVLGNQSINGRKIPVDGELYFQGYNVEDLIKNSKTDRFRFEEATYLLLFGKLPTEDQLKRFVRIQTDLQELSGAFIRDVIMKATSDNLMNS
jgi:citrate synthase